REGATVRTVGPHVGRLASEEGGMLDADASFENEPGVLFDGIVVAGGEAGVEAMGGELAVLEHLRDAYRHGKALLFLDDAAALWDDVGIDADPDDPGLLLGDEGEAGLARFVE